MMTEVEAQERWCPFGRLATAADGNTYDNRGQSVGFTACIASFCMAWRWTGDGGWRLAEDREVHSAETEIGAETVRVGFCGLAGVPQP